MNSIILYIYYILYIYMYTIYIYYIYGDFLPFAKPYPKSSPRRLFAKCLILFALQTLHGALATRRRLFLAEGGSNAGSDCQ